MRYFVAIALLVCSFPLEAWQTYEIPVEDEFAMLDAWAMRRKIEVLVKETGRDFIYCAAIFVHAKRVVRFGFLETAPEAHEAGIELYSGIDMDLLHIFPRTRVNPPKPPGFVAIDDDVALPAISRSNFDSLLY